MTKSYICTIGSLLSIPTACVAFLITSSFYVSISFLIMMYIVSEGWISPAISMIQAIVDTEFKGVGKYYFF